jgi:hypothetical protein
MLAPWQLDSSATSTSEVTTCPFEWKARIMRAFRYGYRRLG